MKTSLAPEVRFARTRDGVSIAHTKSGSGYPLMYATHWLRHLDHDWQTPVWRPWLEALSLRFEVHRYDGRGCGLSEQRVDHVSLDTLVADLEAAVDSCRLQRFALLGMSQGACASIVYAAEHPERVSHLVLLGGFARGALRRDPSQKAAETADAMAKLAEVGWGEPNSTFLQLFTSLFLPGASPEQAASFNEMQRRATTPAQAARLMRAFSDIDASDWLAAIRCPTLVLHCAGDLRVPPAEARLIASSIPGAQLVMLDSPNHFPLPGEPAFDVAVRQIADFVGNRPEAAGTPAAADAAIAQLSDGERRLVELLARGLDNAQIAAHLELSEKTVRNKVSLVFAKMGVENRSQAIVRARDAGLGR
jgi:pimeloyl-ACP methyl ester carboxylesterase/DNA-binding CsgD family transcriptional regulator